MNRVGVPTDMGMVPICPGLVTTSEVIEERTSRGDRRQINEAHRRATGGGEAVTTHNTGITVILIGKIIDDVEVESIALADSRWEQVAVRYTMHLTLLALMSGPGCTSFATAALV